MVAITLLINVRQFSNPSIFSYLDMELINVTVGILQVAFLQFS